MKVQRRNPAIDEAVDVLDQHLINSEGDAKAAFATLTTYEQQFINQELEKCVLDARYYLENYHVVATEFEGLKTLYPFWDSQEIFYTEIIKIQLDGRPVKLIVLKARQLGISTVTEGLIFHKTIFTPGCNTLIVAQDPGQADFLFGMSRLAYDSLPWWMRPEERYQAKGRYLVLDKKDDLERRMSPGLKSQILVEAANKMTGVARGKTIRCAHFSELASWDNGGILSQSIFPTMNSPDELAVMESTAEGRQGFWYSFWKDSWNGNTDWHPLFIEYFRVKKYTKPIKEPTFVLSDEEKALREKIRQRCGYLITDETFNWVRAKKREFISLEGDEWKFYQEYPIGWMEAFQGTGLCAFPKRLLQKIIEGQCVTPRWYGEITLHPEKAPRERVHLHGTYVFDKDGNQIPGLIVPPAEHDGGRLRIWEMPQEGETYYIGADVAHGVEGGDYSCAQVIKIGHGPEPDVQVAEWRGWINPTPFGRVVAALGYYYGNAQAAVECNDVGITTNNELFRVLEYDNIYRWKHIDKIKNFITDFLGWYTNTKTRDAIISKMREAIMDKMIILRSEDLLDEMMDFSSEEGGRFEGQDTNDDRVMALQIAYYCAHDSDYGKEASSQPRTSGAREEAYFLFDDLNRLRGQYTDRDKAEQALANSPANWAIRTIPNRRDFANTDYSPIHDKPGIKQRMHTELGIPAELIMHHEIFSVPSNEDPDTDWKNW